MLVDSDDAPTVGPEESSQLRRPDVLLDLGRAEHALVFTSRHFLDLVVHSGRNVFHVERFFRLESAHGRGG